jgi:uncharacterized damage-inducible protein DinB
MAQTAPANRHDPPLAAPEPKLLAAFLDYHRATLLWKVSGLSDDDLRRPMTASGVTLLGMVKHIAYVERWWFQAVFAGADVSFPWSDADPDAEWRIEPEDTTASIVALYEAETARSRAIAANADLDTLSQRDNSRSGERFSLRWIMLHMIEETARHNGHADLMREAIDGATGE